MAEQDTPAPTPAGADSITRTEIPVQASEVSAIIVRACRRCSARRETGTPCSQCGNPDPPETTELGIISATYRSRWRRIWRTAAGEPLARHRIRKANRRTAALNRNRT